MDRKTLKQQNQTFWGRNFPGASGAKEAKQWFDDYARGQNGYEVVMESAALQHQSAKEALLADEQGNFKHLRLSWLLFVGHRIAESALKACDVKDITLRASPDNLNKAFQFTAGGFLLGGIGGAVLGSLIDEVKGPQRGTITLFLEIGDSENRYQDSITFCVRQLNLVLLNENGLRMIMKKAEYGLDNIKKRFPNKVRF